MGVETKETQDAWGRPVLRVLFSNGTVGQSNVTTSWTYTSRGAGIPGVVTTVSESSAVGTAWTRISSDTVDGDGRQIGSTDSQGVSLKYTSGLALDGSRQTATAQVVSGTTSPLILESKTLFRDGQTSALGGESRVAKTYNISIAGPFTTETETVSPLGLLSRRRFNALGDTLSETVMAGDGALHTLETQFDLHRRVKARQHAGGSGGTYWEVHSWSKLESGGHAHDVARRADIGDAANDQNRRRQILRFVKQGPYGSSSQLWWESVENYLPDATTGAWPSTPASAERTALSETAVASLGGAGAFPLRESVDGGLVSTTSLARERTLRRMTQRLYRLGGLSRTTVFNNGLPTDFSTPEMGLHKLSYSPLREPLAEASFETIPWWPVLALNPGTGQVEKRYLPKTTAANIATPTGPNAEPTYRTASYTYYPGNDIRAGRLQSQTETATGGVTTYDYNARGQLISQSGTGSYPQEFEYDALGRMTNLHTWRTAGDNTTKSTTTWAYVGTSPCEDWKQYPAGQGNTAANLKVDFTWNAGNQLIRRTAQRGVYTDYTYDAVGRLSLVDYSDTTPDVKFDYYASTGLIQKRHDGWGTAGVRVTTYIQRYDGSVLGESINDAGSVLNLTRGYDVWGRQSSLSTAWTSGSGPAFPAITAPGYSYAYTPSQRLAQFATGSGGLWKVDFTKGVTGEGWTLQENTTFSSQKFSFTQNWNLDSNGRASSRTGYVYNPSAGGGTINLNTINQRWSGDRLAARSSGTDRRWEYRHNTRGEVDTAWQQSNNAVIDPAAGETLAGTGVGYAYDAIGNRLSHTEAGTATVTGVSGPNGAATTAVTLQDQRVHNYSPNAANQYTQVTHPGFFNVRGTRAAGAAIVVNGASIPASGYQPGSSGTIFRAEVPNLTPPPAGTTNPDIYEPVKVTQSGVVLTVDDPIQYVPPPVESLTYDADGNLKTDGRWTCTWDAADRLVRMESTAFTQPASTTPPLLAVTVPARVIEFAYDGLSRRIRKKVTEGGSSIVLWEAYVYDGWNMVLSVKLNTAAGASQGRPQSAIASYVWGPDLGSKPFARRDWQAAGGVRGLILASYFTGANGGGLHAPGMDAMGNVTSVTRLGVASTYGGPYFRNEFVYDYDAFGKEMRSSTLVAGLNPDSFPFHYSTKFTDPESGFNYYGYRFYDPANGRWINRDPIGEKGSLNLYGMVGNALTLWFDILGEESIQDMVRRIDAEQLQLKIDKIKREQRRKDEDRQKRNDKAESCILENCEKMQKEIDELKRQLEIAEAILAEKDKAVENAKEAMTEAQRKYLLSQGGFSNSPLQLAKQLLSIPAAANYEEKISRNLQTNWDRNKQQSKVADLKDEIDRQNDSMKNRCSEK